MHMFCVDISLYVSTRHAVADSCNPCMDVDHVRMVWLSYHAKDPRCEVTRNQIIQNLALTRHANNKQWLNNYKYRLDRLGMLLKEEALETWEAFAKEASWEILTLDMFPNRE
jgi:hypothetical protein